MVRGKIMVIVDNSGDRIVSARQMWYIFNCESMLKPLSGKLVIEPTMHPDAPYFIIKNTSALTFCRPYHKFWHH